MKKFLLSSMALGLIASSVFAAPPVIEASEAANYIDQEVTICGKVYDVVQRPKRLLFNLGNKYPREDATIAIWNTDNDAFTKKFGDLNKLKNKRICTLGRVESYKGHLYITASNTKVFQVR